MIVDSTKKKSLIALLADLPRLFSNLVREEIENLKTEIVGKLKHAGIGIGLFVAAGLFAFFMLAAFITAAILGFATIVPGWLAALIVAVILLVITVIIALIGLAQVKKGVPPAPTETIKSVKKDVDAIKGVGKRETP